MTTRVFIAVAAFVALSFAVPQVAKLAEGETIVVEPQGEYSDIDTKATIDVMQRLQSIDEEVKTKAIDDIQNDAGNYAPPALYAMANEMFDLGDKDKAMFWFYLGQLRARSDANKCNDESAREGVAVLNQQFGPKINKYAFRDTTTNYKKSFAALRGLIDKVVEWDRTHSRHYDARWLGLHGLGSFLNDKDPFEPKERWATIDEKTRVDFVASIGDVEEMLSKMDLNGDGAVTQDEKQAYQMKERDKMMQRLNEETKDLKKTPKPQ